MRLKFICFIVFIIEIIFFTGCKKAELKAVNDNSIPLYTCSESETGAPFICFDSLITDSRCPMGVECFWQGTAIIKVTFHENERLHTFKMSLKGFPSLGSPGDTAINGYRIVFADLKPYPEYGKPAPKEGDIKATFSITQ